MLLLLVFWLIQNGYTPNEVVHAEAMTRGTRDAILGTIGGGDVAIMGILYLIVKRMGEIKDELKNIVGNQKDAIREQQLGTYTRRPKGGS